MRVGDLFSGIGGFSLAAHTMGWSTAWFAEIDPFASRVLAHHWPEVPNLGDVTRVDWSTVEPVDLVTGGFPCQPHSLAGKRLASSDERDLFDEIIRCLRVVRPRVAVLENVPGLLTSESGRFFGRVLGSLAEIGYDAEWEVLSAADVGAPHKRERVWIVAYDAHVGQYGRGDARGRRVGSEYSGGVMGHADRERKSQLRGVQSDQRGRVGHAGEPLVHTSSGGRKEGRELPVRRAMGGCAGLGHADSERGRGWRVGQDAADVDPSGEVVQRWQDAIPVRGADGTVRLIPREAATGGPESALWPVAHGVSGRVAQLRGIGNAIVPACAVEIFRRIAVTAQQEAA